jgi:Transport and Golgi organisation 2
MCTAVLSIEAGLPVLLAGVRDELTDRPWTPPGAHWARDPDLVGGQDLQAGGTWLAVAPERKRVSCVLNGIGMPAPASTRRSRGELPLLAAGGQRPVGEEVADFDPFRLLIAEPAHTVLLSWDGVGLTEEDLPDGLHFIVNSGHASELAGSGGSAADWAGPDWRGPPPPDGREHELARARYFLGRFRSAGRPDPAPGKPVDDAWGSWFPLLNGGGIGSDDERALIVRRDLGEGRTWGTTSVSLVGLTADWVRYDFCATPGYPAAWYQVL